jgi:hypothetical protein
MEKNSLCFIDGIEGRKDMKGGNVLTLVSSEGKRPMTPE